MIDNIKGAWTHIYGKKSHMNLAGKIVLGIPAFPLVVMIVLTYTLADALFTKKDEK